MIAPVWDDLVPAAAPGPAVWLLGAHGGAGVSTLCQFYSFAGDSQRRWPCGRDHEFESPLTVIVAQETISGLRHAHELILQHQDEELAAVLLGVVTIASGPTTAKGVRQYRDVMVSSAPAHWAVGWHGGLISAALETLPTWRAVDGLPTPSKGADTVPDDVVTTGVGIVTAAQAHLPPLR